VGSKAKAWIGVFGFVVIVGSCQNALNGDDDLPATVSTPSTMTSSPASRQIGVVLARVAPSPVVELNRAIAVSMADGPAAALELVDELYGRLDNYYLLPSVRGDLLAKLGRPAEARAEFERAAGLTANERERDLLLARAQECA
jgi:predicted RNA polymerase sigma factor